MLTFCICSLCVSRMWQHPPLWFPLLPRHHPRHRLHLQTERFPWLRLCLLKKLGVSSIPANQFTWILDQLFHVLEHWWQGLHSRFPYESQSAVVWFLIGYSHNITCRRWTFPFSAVFSSSCHTGRYFVVCGVMFDWDSLFVATCLLRRRVSQEALSDYGDNLNRHKKVYFAIVHVSIVIVWLLSLSVQVHKVACFDCSAIHIKAAEFQSCFLTAVYLPTTGFYHEKESIHRYDAGKYLSDCIHVVLVLDFEQSSP